MIDPKRELRSEPKNIQKRVEASAWYKALEDDEKASFIAEIKKLEKKPALCETVTHMLDGFEDRNSPWSKLNDDQRKAQILLAIEQYIVDLERIDALGKLKWYQESSSKSEVDQTTETMMRIGWSLPRTARRVDEKAIAASNPWSRLLARRPRP